ncbi:MAG: DUF359 domain-containing protein [Candidatus Heimdallarchaeota archaeon]|nr:DUF359 domain-containing protein [Candidatus Heimdallarchaeota archaeon]MCK5048449.1 DUF359 domain-containing protein [Candidatus Heimdallarchaeota archaeon]
MSQKKTTSNFILLTPRDLKLKDFLIIELRAVFGEFIKGDEENPKLIESQLKAFFEGKEKIISTIGDMCTQTFVEIDLVPDLSIVDGLTRRKQTKKVEVKGAEKRKLANPAGVINKKVWEEIRKHFQEKEKRKQIIIEGEEDLLALAVIIEAPMGSYVVYGVPPINEQKEAGIMIVYIDQKIKKKISKIMTQME